MRPLRLAALVPLVLAGCAGDPAAPEADAGSDSGSASATRDLTLREDGVGRINAETPFDTAAVRAALPSGFATELRTAGAGLTPVMWALRDGQLVLELYADASGTRVARVDAPGEAVAGPDGAHVGQTFADVDGAGMDCEAGTDELSGRAVCAGDADGVLYVFAFQQTLGPDLPPTDSLAGAFLERLVWRADD